MNWTLHKLGRVIVCTVITARRLLVDAVALHRRADRIVARYLAGCTIDPLAATDNDGGQQDQSSDTPEHHYSK